LISSFLGSLFLCRIAPIEVSDASGMNLMNVETLKWDQSLLEACGGPSLRHKLGPEPVLGGTSIGTIGKWWIDKWGFNPSCIIAPFTGDNPSTVVSLSSPGDAILSLGTSTTLLVSIPPSSSSPNHTTTSHLLADPTLEGAYIAMLCYKNGALAREYVRDHYASKDWPTFDSFVENTPAGNDGYIGFYFPLYEIIPQNVVGDYFFLNGRPIPSIQDTKHHPRAVLESQLLSIKSRIKSILPRDSRPLKRLLLTGGSSANEMIRQMASDVLNLEVYTAESMEGGSVGGALLAMYAWWKAQGNIRTLVDMKKDLKGDGFKLVAKPDADNAELYENMLPLYRKCEERVVELSGKNNYED
jgi:xylulokinase